MRPHFDLQQFRILGRRHQFRQLPTMRAGQRFRRQRDELLLDGQMGIIAPSVAGMTGLRATLPWCNGRLQRIEQVVGTVAWGLLLRLAAKAFVLQSTHLALGLTEFLGQLLVAPQSVGMSALPVAHLATKFPHFAPQIRQFPLQTPHGRAIRAASKRLWRLDRQIQKRGTHRATLYPN